MVAEAQAAAVTLAEQGISVELIDLRTISPWDRETVLASVEKTGRAVVVHEAVRAFGIGAEIASEISETLFGKLKAPVRRLGAGFSPVPFSKPLETAYAPNRGDIVETIRGFFA
jgi:pyruvate dehydrogenase E1 component beta subunit